MTLSPLQGRLHPATPLRRSWAVLAALAGLAYQQHNLFSVGTSGARNKIDVPLWVACTAVTVVVAVVLSLFITSWRLSHYSLDGDELEYRSGLLFKVRRHCELHHVQSVDIGQPFFGRLLGVCTLRVVMSGTTMTLSYLTLNQARALKARILAEDTADERLHQVKTADLVVALLLDLGTNLKSLLLVGIGVGPYVLSGELFTLSTLVAFVPKVWKLTGRRLFTYSRWSVTRIAEGSYRTDHGLFDTQQYTYRASRVASIELHQPVLWRRCNWVEVRVAVAGAGKPGVLLPVCPRTVAEKLVLHLLGADAVAHLHAPIPAPGKARRATLFHRALGYRLGNGYFATWRGFFFRNSITICPAARIQTVGVRQGPWQRRLGLANVHAHMAGGNRVSAVHRTSTESTDLAQRLHQASTLH